MSEQKLSSPSQIKHKNIAQSFVGSEPNLVLSSSPHIKDKTTTNSIMRDVLIALMPTTLVGIYFFKYQAILVIVTAILAAVLSEYIWQKATKQTVTIKDLSAALTGLLLALNVPSTLPLWMIAIGSVFSVIIVKQLFGGLGQNVVNPALAGRAFLLASWPVAMTTWTLDGLSSATPLAMLKSNSPDLPTLSDAFLGHIGGCIGEVSAIAILIGAIYLLYKKVITWHIPFSYIATVFILTTIIGRDGFMSGQGFYELFVGGLMIGAFFMATDYTTSPMTPIGQIVFGIGCGVLTSVIRVFGGYPEGVSYSILIMNLFVPLIDKFITPRKFGGVK